MIAGGAVLVIGALIGGVSYWLNVQHERAMAAYAQALVRAQAGRSAQATPQARAAAAREIETVLQRYPSASMAPQAAYELGGLRYADHQYAAARSAYEIAAVRSSGATLKVLSRLGIAYAWEAERNYPKAVESFQAVLAETRPADFIYEDLLLDLGTAQELAGRRDEAIQTYRKILKDVTRSRRLEDVRSRLASLGATPDGAK